MSLQTKISPSELLKHMTIPSEPRMAHIYVVGCFERRVTICSQQIRAYNLVFALDREGLLQTKARGKVRVAVVGAGFAGLTAAVAAAQRGCEVWLLEEKDKLIPVQDGCRGRPIHPYIYDWPHEHHQLTSSGLRVPLLDWSAGPAGEVAARVRKDFEHWKCKYGIQCKTVSDVRIHSVTNHRRKLTWNPADNQSFDLVILAVGFGRERTLHPAPDTSYWHDDRLHQLSGGSRILISGLGDGACMDVLIASLNDFAPDDAITGPLADLFAQTDMKAVQAELLHIEAELSAAEINDEDLKAWLTERYQALAVPAAFDEALKARLRNTRVVLNGEGPDAIDPRASVLNRFLVSRLIYALNRVDYLPGRLEAGAIKTRTGGGYEVTLDGRTYTFDQVVIRHGPVPALTAFPQQWAACEVRMKALATLDQTRQPIWDDDFWEPPPTAAGPSPVIPSPVPVPSESAGSGTGITPPLDLTPAVDLPTRPARFYGRDPLLAMVRGYVLAASPQPVALIGHPGQGKTTLARMLLHDPKARDRFGARRFFVRAEAQTSADNLAAALALGLGLPPGSNPLQRALAVLKQAPALLVIDNLESAWEAEPEPVEELLERVGALAGSHGLALVITLRGGARPGRVGWATMEKVPRLPRVASRDLFLNIANTPSANDPRLDLLLTATDDLALAVELLAYQAEGQPDLEDLWLRWKTEQAELLKRGTANQRETSLPVSINLSVSSSRLRDPGRALLGLLAHLPAGLAREDIRRLLGKRGADGTVDLLRIGLAMSEGDRIRLLSPVRAHLRQAHPNLLEGEDFAKVVGHYFQMAHRDGGAMYGPQGAEVMKRLTAEFANLEAILGSSITNVPKPQPALRAIMALRDFLSATELKVEPLLDRARSAAKAPALIHESAVLITIQGERFYLHGNLEGAEVFLHEALDRLSKVSVQSARVEEADCISRLADVAMHRSHISIATDGYGEARNRYRKQRTHTGVANSIRNLAYISHLRGELTEAVRGYHEARNIYRRQRHPLGYSNCTLNLAEVAVERGELEAAARSYTEARKGYEAIGEPLGAANSRAGMAWTIRERGDLAHAKKEFIDARRCFEQIGEPFGVANCICGLADVDLLSDIDGAAVKYADALQRFIRLDEANGACCW